MKWLGKPSPFHLFTNPCVINRFIFGQGVVIYYLCGDFNCSYIIWITFTVRNDPNAEDRNIHNNLFIEFDLTQVHELATRNGNLLDLVFTTNPTLVKSSVNAPGTSDHDLIVTDTDMVWW